MKFPFFRFRSREHGSASESPNKQLPSNGDLPGRSGRRRFSPDFGSCIPHHLPWRRILTWAGIALASFAGLFLGFVWYLVATAPDIDSITVSPVESATYICDEGGNYLRKLTLASSNRDIVTLEEIPEYLQHAVIAIEDERFYEHGGIDVKGIARAFWIGITSGSFSEGASTITQQLIKNNVFTEWTQENSFMDRFRRKVQEQYLALQLENRIGKEEILEDYLNTINLGAGCYGVQSAAKRYFGKDVSELTLSECSVLAAIPQNPSGYNPILFPEKNRKRQLVILNYMEEQGYITQQERREAESDNVYDRILSYDASYSEENAYSYYEDALIDQVIDVLTGEKGYSEEQAYRAVYSGGLRIYSAQDAYLQQICDEEFSNPANFPAGTEFGIDYALSVADKYGVVTNYGSEALRSYVRENLDPSFNLLCTSADTAQKYADAFREAILSAADEEADKEAEDAEPDAGAAGKETGGVEPDAGEKSRRTKNTADGQTADNDLEDVPPVTLLGERLTLSPQPQASLVLMDQKTGYVRAVVGGRGEKNASLTLNRATDTTRQPGSTFKILTAYAPALDADGQTLATLYDNEPCSYADGTPVSNWDITDYSGPTTVREAIIRSINVIAVRCITEVTPQLGFHYAEKFGITTLHETYESGGNYSTDIVQPLALGGITQGVTNLELCGAYAAIANGGTYRTPKFFTKIMDRHGDVVFDFSASEDGAADSGLTARSLASRDGTRILKDSTAYLLTDAMRGVVSDPSGTAYGTISAAGQPVAGKTGTTSSYKDIWFTGYTPYYTCGVWGGYDNNKNLPDTALSHTYQKVLWSAVMNRVHLDLPAADFEQPDSVTAILLCKDSHLPVVEGACPDTYTEVFAAGTEPEGECGLHELLPETESIIIYPDLLDELLPETESETETGPEAETESGAGTESESESGTGSGTGTESESGAGSGAETESESGAGPDLFPGFPDDGSSTPPETPSEDSSTLPGSPSGGSSTLPDSPSGDSSTLPDSLSGDSGSPSGMPAADTGLFPEESPQNVGSAPTPDASGSQPQSDTNSLQDLIERLYGTAAAGQ